MPISKGYGTYFFHLQTETMRALADERAHTIRLMVEQERRNVDRLRQEVALLSSTSSGLPPPPRLLGLNAELESAVTRLSKLENQLQEASAIRKVRHTVLLFLLQHLSPAFSFVEIEVSIAIKCQKKIFFFSFGISIKSVLIVHGVSSTPAYLESSIGLIQNWLPPLFM